MTETSSEFHVFRARVSQIVRERLGSEVWFHGVCVNGLEAFYSRDDLDGAVEFATVETLYHDGP